MKQTFLYALCGVAAAIILGGCSGMNALLKSGQPELIYSKALDLAADSVVNITAKFRTAFPQCPKEPFISAG